MCAPVNARSRKWREKRKKKFCNDVNECLMKIGRGSRIVLIGDMNGRLEIMKQTGGKVERGWRE